MRCPISYQDVQWGPDDSGPETADPVPLSVLNDFLAGHGYQMVYKDPIDPMPIIQWKNPKRPDDPITLPEPYFVAKGYYDTKVYDLHVIRDMLSRLDGDLGEDGHTIKAKRRDSH